MTLNTTQHLNISSTSSVFSGPTIVTGGRITQQVYGSTTKGGFERLVETSSPAAFHNSEQRLDPPKCHPDTRIAVLNRITDWVLGTDAGPRDRRAFMMWLYGSAGVGKSAIAQTIAERFDADGSLLASFFFSRSDPTRSHARPLFATIAYQIALNIPEAKVSIVAAIEYDPLIFSKSYETQFTRLIIEPLQSVTRLNNSISRRTYVIVIDGLDECTDKDARSNILRLLMNTHQKHSLPIVLLFLISSRPELDIKTIIDSHGLETRPSRLGLDGDYMPNNDIRIFLQDKFQEIKIHHPHRAFIPAEWPSDGVINKLVRTSSGQFIYAATVVKYLSSATRKPTTSLDVILGLHPARSGAPFAALDELYTFIFSTVDDLDLVLRVLGLIILCKSHFTFRLEEILGLEVGDIETQFGALGSIVSLDNWDVDMKVVKILHASLEDFLLDDVRSKKLYLNPPLKHAEYAHLYFGRIISETRGRRFEGASSSLIYNLERALLTNELQEDIRQFSLGKVYSVIRSVGQEDYFFNFVPPFLSGIKALQGKGETDLHDLQQGHFDKFLRRSLGSYYANPELTFIVTILPFIESLGRDFPVDPLCLTRSVSDGAFGIDSMTLRILGPIPFHSPASRPYYRYLAIFLRDSTRSGPYALTEGRFAKAASYLYKRTCQRKGFLQHEAYLDMLGPLLDCAGKSPWLLNEITNLYANFKSSMQLEASKQDNTKPRSKKIKLAEDAVENYLKKMSER
ncbi:hypothetical protein GALMADRAFT_147135 [Galerina marginata CBS 339.88]|uniref:NACHT domain-containing protein n=1 Tax=Galerina marginata (strain CBS 339.88) TaxID=685588 RepID=A0A067SKN1_GALM3|nr:hypothetical protein GALMADRAFT_147135 [Galerina marginata CBS 339.88]